MKSLQQNEPVWRSALRFAVSDGVPRRSLRIALVVGSILNLINQGDALFGGALVNWWKGVLTYVVPYLVSTYGVVAFRLARPSPPIGAARPRTR